MSKVAGCNTVASPPQRFFAAGHRIPRFTRDIREVAEHRERRQWRTRVRPREEPGQRKCAADHAHTDERKPPRAHLTVRQRARMDKRTERGRHYAAACSGSSWGGSSHSPRSIASICGSSFVSTAAVGFHSSRSAPYSVLR